MGGKGSGSPKGELMVLDGHTFIDGKMEKTKFFDFLGIDLSDYSHVTMTPKQALKFKNTIVRMKHGVSAVIPMICSGPKCPNKLCVFHEEKNWPLTQQCHPPGTLIKTSGGIDIPIEELDPDKHRVVSFFRKRSQIRTNHKSGYYFDVASRPFSGRLIKLNVGIESHEVTPDHISVVRLNENAFGKFCVYLMRKGTFWRVGKSQLCSYSNGVEKKAYSGFMQRSKREKADAVWILGVYDTNTEALLAEEYFSITWHASRACFQIDNSSRGKHDGLYKWVTNQQLSDQHTLISKPEEFYRKKLKSIGLDIRFPIWEKDYSSRKAGDIKFYTRYPMFIQACNIISGVMDLAIFPRSHSGNLHQTRIQWLPVSIEYREYSGLVYSLDVKNSYKTYFANNIATHNCIYEVRMVQGLTKSYVEDLGVDPESPTEMVLVNKLVECDLIDYRANLGLSGGNDEEAPTLLSTSIVDNGKTTSESVNVHPLLDAKSKAHKDRLQILEALAATRRERYKKAAALKKSDDTDASSFLAKLKSTFDDEPKTEISSLDKIKEDAKKVSEDISSIEADWEEVDG